MRIDTTKVRVSEAAEWMIDVVQCMGLSRWTCWLAGVHAGELPKRQQRLVEAWAELHQAELMADWDRLQTFAYCSVDVGRS